MYRKCLPLTFLLAGAAVTSIAQFPANSNDTGGKSEGPEFVDTVKHITVPVGRSATLMCTVRNLGSHKIGWIRMDSLTLLAVDSALITRNNRVFLMRNNDSSSLLIHDVKDSDAGRYACQINTSPMKTQEITLHVVGPPVLDEGLTSSDTRAYSGKSIALRCVARGKPEPTIMWRREDGADIITENNFGVKHFEGEWLNISRLHGDHAGAYICVASNGVPPAVSKRIWLKVISRSTTTHAPTKTSPLQSREPVFVDPLGNVTVPLGQTASLKCTIRNLGEHRVAWLKSDPPIVLTIDSFVITRDPRVYVVNINDSYTLDILYARYEDAGLYRCKINMRSHEVYLKVVGPPVIDETLTSPDFIIADTGKNVSLRCVAKGTPEPTITWQKEESKENTFFNDSSQNVVQGEWLNLTALRQEDSGTYVCTASNGASPLPFKRIVLQVKSPRSTYIPRNNGLVDDSADKSESYTFPPPDNEALIKPVEPEFVNTTSNITVSEGRQASLTCIVKNLRGYRVAWVSADRHTVLAVDSHVITRDPRISVDTFNNSHILKIHDVQRKNAGRYYCQINTDPIRSREYFLQVYEPPHFQDRLLFRNTTADAGEDISLRCVAKGFPQPTVKWHREDGKEIMSRRDMPQKEVEGEWLNLTRINYSDAGIYVCTARNHEPTRPNQSFTARNSMESVAIKRINLKVTSPRSAPRPPNNGLIEKAESYTTLPRNNGPADKFGGYTFPPPDTEPLEPAFVNTTSNVTVSEGREASLTCTVQNLHDYRVAWVNADRHSLLAVSSFVITRDPRIFVDEVDNSYTLRIRDVRYKDSGRYYCQINTDPIKTREYTLQVYEPPHFQDRLLFRNTSADAGEDLSLRCVAKGVPQPTVKWHREDGKEIMSLNDMPQREVEGEWLNLTRINHNNSGIYVCTARNPMGSVAVKRINLKVNYLPEISSPVEQVQKLSEGSRSIKLVCIARGHPAPLVYWVQDGGDVITMSSDDLSISEEYKKGDEVRTILTFPVITRKHFGYYRCIAKNSRGEADYVFRIEDSTAKSSSPTPTIPPNVDDIFPANDIHLNGVTRNVTVPLGGQAHLKCHLSDLGRYKVAWIRIDKSTVLSLGSSVIINDSRFSVKIERSGYSTFRIERAGYEDSGLYGCQINTNPVKTEYTSLEVTGPSFFDEFLSSPSTVAGYLGEIVSLRCAARNRSRQPIIWRRESAEADAPNTKSATLLAKGEWLNMTTLSRGDAGIYICAVGNGASPTAYRRISLEVFYPPEIVAINFDDTESGGSDTATLSCGARGHPAPTVYWTKRGYAGSLRADVSGTEVEKHKNDESRLTSFLRRVQHKEIDLYSCVAKNALGETTAELKLINANNGPRKE